MKRASGGTMYIPTFMKYRFRRSEFVKGDARTNTHKHGPGIITLLFFFQNNVG
jgi:hypothetical protein